MRTNITRRVAGALTTSAIGVVSAVAVASPASAAYEHKFEIGTRSSAATLAGSYESMMGIPENPPPPIAVEGTINLRNRNTCGIVQVSGDGPADELVWRTIVSTCRRGTTFNERVSLMRGGFAPSLRLCAGRAVAAAELAAERNRCIGETQLVLR
ncbi:hypothetical protein [Pilimelia columellifera]